MSHARKVKLDRATALHEAGHAVGRVLTAEAMGYKPEEAVVCIEIGISGSPMASLDGQVDLISAAKTDGPRFSHEIVQLADSPSEAVTIAKAKEAGCNLNA